MGAKHFKNATSPTVSIRFQPNFMTNMIVMGGMWAITFLSICQKLKLLWHFEIFVSTGPFWGWKFQIATPTVFIGSHPNFMRTLLTMANAGYYSSWQSAKFYKIDGTLKF